ncbi:MAG: hypothetical protein K0Q79_3454 [Flavipsychrobacter sp.]|jgi:hypothetical protein|nr:hypothetical protein [Flavipsychrobacter sp.]
MHFKHMNREQSATAKQVANAVVGLGNKFFVYYMGTNS